MYLEHLYVKGAQIADLQQRAGQVERAAPQHRWSTKARFRNGAEHRADYTHGARSARRGACGRAWQARDGRAAGEAVVGGEWGWDGQGTGVSGVHGRKRMGELKEDWLGGLWLRLALLWSSTTPTVFPRDVRIGAAYRLRTGCAAEPASALAAESTAASKHSSAAVSCTTRRWPVETTCPAIPLRTGGGCGDAICYL